MDIDGVTRLNRETIRLLPSAVLSARGNYQAPAPPTNYQLLWVLSLLIVLALRSIKPASATVPHHSVNLKQIKNKSTEGGSKRVYTAIAAQLWISSSFSHAADAHMSLCVHFIPAHDLWPGYLATEAGQLKKLVTMVFPNLYLSWHW